MRPSFSEPTEDDTRVLARSLLAVTTLVREEYGAELDQSPASIDFLQRIRDDDLVGEDGYVALGVALGCIMVNSIPGLDWWIVVDEFGRDSCIRFENTTLRVNPVSMVVKRSAPGVRLDFRELFEATRKKVAELAPRVD
jgi:hypothetical protein